MCIQPVAWPEPEPQIAAAIAAKYRGKRQRPLAVQIRDRLGQWLGDEDFAQVFGIRGRPGWSPSRLALVTVLQRAEHLTDRLAAESVRTRIDWQYLLGLPLDDPGFDHTVLAEFRGRVADAGLEQVMLDALLARLAAGGLVKAGGKQRTDSTHVIAAVAALNRLELAGESVRAALEALTAAHPAWVEQRVCVPDFARRYGTPMTSWRPPVSQARRDELAVAYARDGYALLEAVYDRSSPAWLRELPAVDVLRRVLLQNYTRTITGDGREVIRRREKEPEGDGLPHGHTRIASPYDTDARWGVKREHLLAGLQAAHHRDLRRSPAVHLPPRPGSAAARPAAAGTMTRAARSLVFPNLITNVATTDATVTDNQMTEPVHDDARGQEPGPGPALPRFGIPQRRLGGLGTDHLGHRADRAAAGRHLRPGPRGQRLRPRRLHRRLRHMRPSPARKARHRRPGRRAPSEARTRSWPPSPPATAAPARPAACAPPGSDGSSPCCPATWPKPRPPPAPPDRTTGFQADYARRAGVEGTMHQAASHGARRARYRGLPKTRLDHVYMATALNLLRLEAFWTGTPLDRQRTSHLARLELSLAA